MLTTIWFLFGLFSLAWAGDKIKANPGELKNFSPHIQRLGLFLVFACGPVFTLSFTYYEIKRSLTK